MSDDMKMGYYVAQCDLCGERYNGYTSHSCPLSMAEATARADKALHEYRRAKAAEPHRKKKDALLDELVKAVRKRAKPRAKGKKR